MTTTQPIGSYSPRTSALAEQTADLGPGGRALYQNQLWTLAYSLERELVECNEILTTAQAEITALRAECEGLRKDAERYLWLRDAPIYSAKHNSLIELWLFSRPNATAGAFDRAIDDHIDAAMNEGRSDE